MFVRLGQSFQGQHSYIVETTLKRLDFQIAVNVSLNHPLAFP
jgi:hypothetical protein